MYNTETAVLFNSVFYVLINLIMTDKNKKDTFYKKNQTKAISREWACSKRIVKFNLIVLYSYRDAQVLNPDRGFKFFGKFWILAVVEEYIRRPLLVFYSIFISKFSKSYTVSLYPLFEVCNNVCLSKPKPSPSLQLS